MALSKPAAAFSPAQKILHWTVVVLLILQEFVFDGGMGRYFHAYADGKTGAWTTTSIAHLLIGTVILLLAIWRVALRATHGAPAAPDDEPALFSMLAKVTHGLLYLLLFALPLTGLISWFGKYDPLTDVHKLLSDALLVLAGLHVAAVAVHHLVWRTNLLGRMI
ncbi:cytochrome b [Acidimangrovimonas sediminis]|uniref:cytochrome b n=1 Tax=Acidimangrovimonas sediminis TaxID=2056283 RepID=UPI001304C80A|nr:cytochrome b/b6 domain-containing protein [Acidimangrovimonas sediminis]